MKKSKKGSGSKVDSGTPTGPSPKVIAQRRASRATFIRKKLKTGGKVSDDERAFLAAYDAEPHGSSSEAKAGGGAASESGTAPPGERGAASEPPGDAPGTAAARPAMEPQGEPGPREGERPETPPPPRVGGFAQRARGGGGGAPRWQDNYAWSPGGGSASGREAVCSYVGSLWHGVLKQCADSLREVGVDPIIEPDDLAGAIVLTVDQLLPPEAELTPEVFAALGSTAIVGQRFLHRQKIKEARERAEAKERFSGSKPVPRADDRPPAPQPQSEPAPPPEAEVMAGVVALAPRERTVPYMARKAIYNHDPKDLT